MSGELDTRPSLTEQIRELRDKVRDLESRVNGDENGLDLSDLNDVRVDEMVDPGVTLVDGSALVYRASNKIWIAGAAVAQLPAIADDGTFTYEVSVTSLTTDPTDLGGDGQALQLSVYNSDLSAESAFYLSAAGQSWLFAQEDLLIQASSGTLNLQSAGVMTILSADDIHISSNNAGRKVIFDGSWAFEMVRVAQLDSDATAYGNSTAGTALLWCRTSGGKVQIVARFPSGAVQILAAEP